MTKFFSSLLAIGLSSVALAQSYSDVPGAPGSSAISKDSSCFVAWATGATITRGYLDINDTLFNDNGTNKATFGVPENALGMAEGDGMSVVSLGDGGMITLTFSEAITDGPGFDFAVFENSFLNHYMEFAFVEVSSNGVDFVRFPSDSEIQTTSQLGNASLADCRMVNNLAGKYRAGFGTPFDLSDVAQLHDSVDVQAISHIRLIDVIGAINGSHVSLDADGQAINDPYPTPFPSGGFDLDAVGVIHQYVGLTESKKGNWTLYPNPTKGILHVTGEFLNERVVVRDLLGQIVHEETLVNNTLDLQALSDGSYLIELGARVQNIVLQR